MVGIWGWAVDGAPAQHLLRAVSEVTPLWAQTKPLLHQLPRAGRVHPREEEGHGELRAGAVLVQGGHPVQPPPRSPQPMG